MSEVSLEDVGNAEAILQRMIHERKTLENAAALLATYRSVTVQLEQARQQLVRCRAELAQVQSDTADARAQQTATVIQIQKEVAYYRQEQFAKANADIEQWRTAAQQEQEKLTALKQEATEAYAQQAQWRKEYTVEMSEAAMALEKVKAEHAALMAQLTKAAAQFTIAAP